MVAIIGLIIAAISALMPLILRLLDSLKARQLSGDSLDVREARRVSRLMFKISELSNTLGEVQTAGASFGCVAADVPDISEEADYA